MPGKKDSIQLLLLCWRRTGWFFFFYYKNIQIHLNPWFQYCIQRLFKEKLWVRGNRHSWLICACNLSLSICIDKCMCAYILQIDIRVCLCSVFRLSLTLRDPVDHSLPGSSVHRISQARTLEWFVISFSRDPPDPGSEPRSPALQADLLPTEL